MRELAGQVHANLPGRQDAATILSKILRKGTIYKSVEEMDFAALDGLAILLFEFAESALEDEESFV